jgi:hypothetical protein
MHALQTTMIGRHRRGKLQFLDQVCVFEEHGLAAPGDLGEQSPSECAGAEVDAVGKLRVDAARRLPMTSEKMTV